MSDSVPEGASPETPPAGEPDTAHEEQIAKTLKAGALPESPPAEEDADTADDLRGAKTLRPEAPPEAPPEEEEVGTAGERRVDGTLPAGGVPAPPPSEDHVGDSDQRLFDETVESDKLLALSVSSDANPLSSIKAEVRAGVAESRLIIPSRVVRKRSEPPVADADYEVLGEIDVGGMGVIHSARQASINREVALKTLKPDRADHKGQRESLLSEAVVTGYLEHPNIVPIYDLGINAEGELFYSMKHVKGVEWDEVIRKKTLEENLEALLKVCDAIAFAHSRGWIHRDLKPKNIMLGDFAEVLVMDFGLAMSPGTRSGSFVEGTPAYMAPEMARGHIEQIDFRTDVYLLGAILFEIITGKPPHPGKKAIAVVGAAAKNEIRPTDRSGELLDIALKAMATAAKDRYDNVGDFQAAIREYQAHSESISLATRAQEDLDEAEQSKDYDAYSRALFGFQEALELWEGNATARSGVSKAGLAYAGTALRKGDYDLGMSLLDVGQPEHAKLHQQLQTAARKRDAHEQRLRLAKLFGVALAAAFFIVVAGAAIWLQAKEKRARIAEAAANTEKDRARDAEGRAKNDRDLARDAEDGAKKDRDLARKAEDQAKNDRDLARKAEDRAKNDRDLARKAEDQAKQAQEEEEYGAYITRIGLAAANIEENAFDRARMLLKECPRHLRHWEWGRLMYLCSQHLQDVDAKQPIEAVAFSRDGKRFATGGWGGVVYVWDTQSGDRLAAIPTRAEYVFALAFSPDGSELAMGTNDKPNYLKVWDFQAAELRQLPGHKDTVVSVAYSAKMPKQLLTGSYDGTAKRWDLTTGDVLQTFHGHDQSVWSAAFSPDEKWIVTASEDGYVIVWTVETGEHGPPFRGHKEPVYAAVFSPDGKCVASAGQDRRVLIWDPASVEQFDVAKLVAGIEKNPPPKYLAALEGHTAAARSVQFSGDGKWLISSGNDNTVRIWEAATGNLLETFRGHGGWVLSCVFSPLSSPDDCRILSGSHDGHAKIWSLATYEEERILRGHEDAVLGASFSSDSRQIVSASRDRKARIWDLQTGSTMILQEGHEFLTSAAVFFPDGSKVVTAAVDNTTRIWDTTRGTQEFILEHTGPSAAVALSHDGTRLLTGSDDKTAKIWVWDEANKGWGVRHAEEEEWKPNHTLRGHRAEVTAVAISPDDKCKWLLTGDRAGVCRLWDAQTYKLIWESARHNGGVVAAVFLSSERVLTASTDYTVAQWDVKTGTELSLLKHPDAVTSMALSRDGKWLLTACPDKAVEVWDPKKKKPGEERVTTVRLWDVETGKQKGEFSSGDEAISDVAFSADGRYAVTTNSDYLTRLPDGRRTIASDPRKTVRKWDLQTFQEVRDGGPLLSSEKVGDTAWSAVYSPDGQRLLTVGGNEARLWDATTGELIMEFRPHESLASAHFSPNGKFVLTGSWDKSARIWNASSRQVEMKLRDGHKGFVKNAVFSPDGSMVLTASDDETAKLWKYNKTDKKWEVDKQFLGHTARVNSAVFSLDGKWVLTASDDKKAGIWDVATGELLLPFLEGHDKAVLSASFSADGQWVITGSEDKSARLWNAATGKLVEITDPTTGRKRGLILRGHSAGVTSVALSADKKRAITGSRDGMAKLWELQNGEEMLTLKKHTEEVTSVAFSPDGRTILTGSRDRTLIVWHAKLWLHWYDGIWRVGVNRVQLYRSVVDSLYTAIRSQFRGTLLPALFTPGP